MSSTYLKPLIEEYKNQPKLATFPVKRVYPVKDNMDSVGFRLSKQEAIKIATQLLLAADVSDEIFLQGSRKNQNVWIARYNGGSGE